MPELPEVEAARRAIEEHCTGKKIRRCSVAEDSKVIDGVSPSDLQSALIGKIIVAALRKGKNLWLRLDSPPFPSFQFGMSGAVYIKGVAVTKYKRSSVSDKDEWPSKYSKVFMELEDGLELSFTDKRRFAKVRLLQDPETMPPISELGPDAFLELLHIDEFVNALGKKKIAIKALLLHQGFISGIGNWIADEVLYQARIHPLQIASSLSRDNCESLRQCIKEVIQYAVEVDADCSSFPVEWLFHYRWGKKSGKVNGKRIEFITAGGRTSAFVPELQKLRGVKSGKAQSSHTKKAKPADEDDEYSRGEEIEEESKRPWSKKGKNTNTGSQRQQKKTDDADGGSEDADEEEKERPKGKIGKKSLAAGRKQGKVVEEVNGSKAINDEEKSANGRAKTHAKATKDASKKRSDTRDASTHQKKKTRK